MHVHVYAYVCMCVCIYVIYIYVYIQTLCLKTSMHDYPYIDCIAHNSFILSQVHKEKGKNI